MLTKENVAANIVLHDIAGAVIATFFLAPLISVAWNAIVLTTFMALAKSLKTIALGKWLLGLVIVSIGGALIDYFTYIAPTSALVERLFFEFSVTFFATHPEGTTLPSFSYPPFIGLYFMPLAIVCIGLLNLLVGKYFFKLNWLKSEILGITMGLLTAPWLVYLYDLGAY